MHYIPILRLRVDERTEREGIDDACMGEYAYDYVGQLAELMPYSSGADHRGSETYMMKERHSIASVSNSNQV